MEQTAKIATTAHTKNIIFATLCTREAFFVPANARASFYTAGRAWFVRKVGRANAGLTKRSLLLRAMIKTGRSEHRSSADFF